MKNWIAPSNAFLPMTIPPPPQPHALVLTGFLLLKMGESVMVRVWYIMKYKNETRRKLRVFLVCYIVLLIYIEYVYNYLCCIFAIFAYFIMTFQPILKDWFNNLCLSWFHAPIWSKQQFCCLQQNFLLCFFQTFYTQQLRTMQPDFFNLLNR